MVPLIRCDLNKESFNLKEADNNGTQEILPLGKEAPKSKSWKGKEPTQYVSVFTHGCLMLLAWFKISASVSVSVNGL